MRRLPLPWRTALSLLALGLVWPAPAEAFRRSRDPDSGRCLWWDGRQITYHVNESCSSDIPQGQCMQAVQESFDVWTDVACSDLVFVSGGTTDQSTVGFDQENWDDNINLVVWVESGWIHGSTAIAMTTTTYDTVTGEIVDADVEMNGEHYTFTATDALTQTDVQNTLVHEAGHVLGLDHSSNLEASMYGEADAKETIKRDLHQDDINGLCNTYPTDASTPRCADDPPLPNGEGCACGPASGGVSGPAAGLAVLFASLVRLRTRGRGQRPAIG